MLRLRELRAAWTLRPPSYSRSVWALILGLHRLPFPWGEDIMAATFVARAFIRAHRLRQAVGWAAAQPTLERGRWRLALSLCAHHGRFVARSALVGVRDPAALHGFCSVRGAEHLANARGSILLGFHLGPAGAYLVLRVAGHRVLWVGGRGASGAWSPAIRARYQEPSEARFFVEDRHAWVRRLLHARRSLERGEHVFISADGDGPESFTVPVPGGAVAVGRGWLTLRRATGAAVLPVLSHMEGRAQVVTVHPPLPRLDADPDLDQEACRKALARVLAAHVRNVPEQCYSLAFPLPPSRDAPLGPAR